LTVGEWLLGDGRVSIAESTLPSGDGKILLIHDVTAAHRMQAELERNQRLAAMGEMAASLAHQLRTPLAAALLHTSNLGQAGLSDEMRVRFSEKATGQLRRLERLIQDVLLFARGESIGRDVIEAGDLLAEAAQTVEPLMRERGLGFSVTDGCEGRLSWAVVNRFLVRWSICSKMPCKRRRQAAKFACPAIVMAIVCRSVCATAVQALRAKRRPGYSSHFLQPKDRELAWAWPLPWGLRERTVGRSH
jgi:hypothetical protein